MVPGNAVALTDIPFDLNLQAVLKQLRLRRESKTVAAMIEELIEAVRPVAKPKAVYRVSYVDQKNADQVTIDGVTFSSRILTVNLSKIERVFPYVVTCGREIDAVTVPSSDLLKQYCLDTIKRLALNAAFNYLKDYLTRNYALGQLSKMSPGSGSVEDWPIVQQRELFSLMGNVEDLIGVKLTENFLMLPLKSVSGIYFPAEIKFESCQLCPREVCIGRRAPYDPELVKKYQIRRK